VQVRLGEGEFAVSRIYLSLFHWKIIAYDREPGYTTQRKIAAWIGGSIVASLSTYKQFKITRQEWEENAESCIQTKSL